MKKLCIALVGLLLFCPSASAQTLVDAVRAGVRAQKEAPGHFQYGVNLRYEPILIVSYEQKAAMIAFGYRFNRKNYLGLNAGISPSKVCTSSYPFEEYVKFVGVPLTLDYIRYCPIGKRKHNSFIYGAEAGALVIGKDPHRRNLSQFYGFLKAGFDFRLCEAAHIHWNVEIGFLTCGLALGFTF